ncbi:MAG: Hsp20/alpha crystallin family protein [Gemmataceae bacterium]|nr:Hsp20/alpha crystallin family protein [Gemmataceae bacterium]
MSQITPFRQFPSFFEALRGEMDQALQRMVGTSTFESAFQKWSPHVDVEETPESMTVKAELPGVAVQDVDITIDNINLVIRGEKKEQHDDKQKQYHRSERFFGQFYRSIPLPAEADVQKIKATCDKGVFMIAIPKKSGATATKVQVSEKS